MNTSLTSGINTSTLIEITNISSHGLWLYAYNKEFFLSYSDFPWFKDRTIREITNVIEVSKGHFYWPNLDVDLTLVHCTS